MISDTYWLVRTNFPREMFGDDEQQRVKTVKDIISAWSSSDNHRREKVRIAREK